jgi:hypothetical protein
MSCLFNSLGHLLNIPSNNVRQSICDYLEANKPILDGMETHEILAMERPDYIKHMRQSRTWGGAIEIQAATNIWKVRIVVQNRRDSRNAKPIEFLPMNITSIVVLTLYWTGGHYEPVSNVRLM